MTMQVGMTPASAPSALTPEQQKIVQSLSGDQYQWRTLERIAAVTGLEREALDDALTELLKRDVVKPSFSKKHNIIFGLRERVDKK